MGFTNKIVIGRREMSRRAEEFKEDTKRMTDIGITDGVINTPNKGGQEEIQSREGLALNWREGYADDTTLMAESEELKSLLMKVQEKSEKVGLKLNIQKPKIMASGPITSWQIDGETMETLWETIFWAPKSLQMVSTAMKLKDACSLKEKLWPT